MGPATPFDWHRVFVGDQPPLFLLEIVLRVVVIYLYAVVLMRLMGKRGSRNLSNLENVVIMAVGSAVGSAVGDAVFYPKVPITYAFVVVTVIVLPSRVIADLQVRSGAFNDFVDGRPLLTIRDGRVLDRAVRRARLRHDGFLEMLRLEGVEDTGRVRRAFLERSGELSLVCYERPEEVEGLEREDTAPELFDVAG